ncbi:MAG: hypothetical protein Q8N99_03795 [Nanoarchaeota archaeon]|nr:hypothetical protein [Nanoarchaeota archaeon]
MGIFDIFKKKIEAKETLSSSSLDEFIDRKSSELTEKESRFNETIKQRLVIFIESLENKVKVLESIDLKDRKADERAKFIVKENLQKYISNVTKLMDKLKEVQGNSEKSLERINMLINDFEKKSFLNYEKATFLIGKELGSIKDAISLFFKNLNLLIEDNKPFLDSIDIINKIKRYIKDLKNQENLENEIKVEIKKGNEEKESSIKEINIGNYNLNLLKNSEKYYDELNFKKKIEEKKANMDRDIIVLRSIIDFKTLANVFHYEAKKMSIINEHKQNFRTFLDKDNLMQLIRLMQEAGLDIKEVIKKTNETKERLESIRIEEERDLPETNKIYALVQDIKKLENRIKEIDEEESRSKKRIDKIKENKLTVIDSLKQELLKFNVELKA